MIHHISIPAENPHHVADVIAELWNGRAFPFPLHPGSYIAFSPNNNQGICIEVYPMGTEMLPGTENEEVQYRNSNAYSQFIATHGAISVPISQEEIEAIASREGWRAVFCDRGPGCFQLVEFWVENHLLLELLTPEMVPQYTAFMTPENWEQFLAAAAPV